MVKLMVLHACDLPWALWIFFVLSVSYVSQHCSVHVVFTYVANSSIIPAALLACMFKFPPLYAFARLLYRIKFCKAAVNVHKSTLLNLVREMPGSVAVVLAC
jgi:hypothetical protein